MNTDLPAKKKHWWSDDDDFSADEHEDHPKVKMVRREVKHLRRVPKRGKMAVRHMSETLTPDKVTGENLEITRKVLEGIDGNPTQEAPPTPKAPNVPTFGCFECSARIPMDSERCPECGILYVSDPKGEALDVSLVTKDTVLTDAEGVGGLGSKDMSFAHFDVKTGMLTCLRTDGDESDFGLECHNCGALTQFGTDKCPLCHHSFDEWDTGLIGLLEGLKFDLDEDKELNCPLCGEHVVAEGGRCPSCKEVITYRTKNSPDAIVIPILKEKDVVFVHFDILNSDLWFASKVRPRKANVPQTIHLDSISKGGFDQNWKGLSRI